MELHEHVEYKGRTICSCGDYNCASLDIPPSPSGTESRERNAIMSAYPTQAWKKKVRGMPDNQVTAVYLRLKSDGKVK